MNLRKYQFYKIFGIIEEKRIIESIEEKRREEK
jgi:hypothetical protein